MKFKAGQLVEYNAHVRATAASQKCIVLEAHYRAAEFYKVYMIKEQRIRHVDACALSPIRPQEAQSEV